METTAVDIAQANRLFSYDEYKEHVNSLFEKKQVTGEEQSEALLETTGMNLHRMKRIEKTGVISENLRETMQSVQHEWTWYLILEGWCGDGSQNAPIIAQIAENSPKVELKLLLRDENPEIMDNYLTNGGRAVPKLICIDNKTGEELGTWGPRPEPLQEFVLKFKKENPKAPKSEFLKNLHLWYARDKGETLQREFLQLVGEWKSK